MNIDDAARIVCELAEDNKLSDAMVRDNPELADEAIKQGEAIRQIEEHFALY